MKKRGLFAILTTLMIIGIFITYILIKNYNDSKVYNGIATIVSAPSFKKVTAEIRSDQNGDAGKAEIYTSIFRVGDKVKVEYSKRGRKYNITKIESLYNTREEKTKMISRINSNVVPMRNYREIIKGTVEQGRIESRGDRVFNIYPLIALPEKIAGQYYDFKIEPGKDFDIKYTSLYFASGISENSIITISSEYSFKVLSLHYIDENGFTVKMPYDWKGKSLILKAVENSAEKPTKYLVKIEFENGDIINYIFV